MPNQDKQNIPAATKTYLFGNPTPNTKNTTTKTNNLFGNPQPNNTKATNNLFENPNNAKKKPANNLFGTPINNKIEQLIYSELISLLINKKKI